jgi:hypothetical protein
MHELTLQFVAQADPWIAAPHQAIVGAILGAGVGMLGGIYGTMLGRIWYRQAEHRRLEAEEFRRS